MAATVRRVGERMRDVGLGHSPRLECAFGLVSDRVAAVVFGPNRWGVSALVINRWLLRGRQTEPVLLWARRELATGARAAWLLADELDDLA